jgi:hypothetical protein
MTDIKLVKCDDTRFEVWTSAEISREFTLKFSARPNGYKFMPSYKSGMWDGWIRFYKNNKMSMGLLDEVIKFAKENEFTIEQDFDNTLGLERSDFERFIPELNLPQHFELRQYQLAAAYDCINDTKRCVKANTSAGKSLIMYYIIRFLAL